MGGEDFAWYLDQVPGALARLGVRAPGGAAFDLHQGTFDIDEAALDVGVRYTVALARAAPCDALASSVTCSPTVATSPSERQGRPRRSSVDVVVRGAPAASAASAIRPR